MTQWEYLTAPTLTHAAKQVLDICAGPPTGGRKNCVIPPPSGWPDDRLNVLTCLRSGRSETRVLPPGCNGWHSPHEANSARKTQALE